MNDEYKEALWLGKYWLYHRVERWKDTDTPEKWKPFKGSLWLRTEIMGLRETAEILMPR